MIFRKFFSDKLLRELTRIYLENIEGRVVNSSDKNCVKIFHVVGGSIMHDRPCVTRLKLPVRIFWILIDEPVCLK